MKDPYGVLNPDSMNFVSKSWGWESWICNNHRYCGKKLFIKQSKNVSYHYHRLKDEVLYVESGKIEFIYSENEKFDGPSKSVTLTPGMAFHVKPGQAHQMYAYEDSMLLEFSTQHFDEDSVRITRDLVIVSE